MTFAYACILLAAMLPVVWVGFAKVGGSDYNNDEPRVYLAGLSGWQKRADWAQMNALEAFPPFAAGVIVAQLAGVGEFTINILAGLFIAFRILHGIFYIKGIGPARSLIWLGGFLCVIGLFVAAL